MLNKTVDLIKLNALLQREMADTKARIRLTKDQTQIIFQTGWHEALSALLFGLNDPDPKAKGN